jgi:molybdopterin-guanine dinucleotide biosynthesis protein
MAIVVVGGNSRNIGKTTVVAGLIARLPHLHWTAFKVTQYGHGFCTADGKPCQCQTAEACVSVSAERDSATGTDTARFLAAGAARSIWVRTRIGMLAEAVPRIREELARSENAILESNSILDYLEPDLYLSVIDPSVADFKESARAHLRRADAILLSSRSAAAPAADPLRELILDSTQRFSVRAPDYISDEVVAFVCSRLAAKTPGGPCMNPSRGNLPAGARGRRDGLAG